MVLVICEKCREAADDWGKAKTVLGKVRCRQLHEQCRGGTWCDCQHQTDARPDVVVSQLDDGLRI